MSCSGLFRGGAYLVVCFLVVLCWLAPTCPSTRISAQDFLGRSFQDWEADLRNGKQPLVRRTAAFALGRMGGLAADALDSLIIRTQVAAEPDASVREMCALASGRIIRDVAVGRSLRKDTLESLQNALKKDPSAEVRRAAAVALGAFGPLGRSAVRDLTEALQDKESSVRQNAARALGEINTDLDAKAIAGLMRLLEDTDVMVRRDSSFALGRLGKSVSKDTARPLLNMVQKETDEVVRKTVLDALSRVVGPESQEFAVGLYPLLKSSDPNTVRATALVLGNMGGEPAERAIPVLRKLLVGSTVQDQALAAAALANLGTGAIPAVPELSRVLRASRDVYVRRNAALALYNVGKEAETAVGALASAVRPRKLSRPTAEELKAEDIARAFMTDTLGKIGYPAIREALPTLAEMIRADPSPTVRHKAVWSLRTLNIEEMREHKFDVLLTKILEERTDSPLVRYDAARVLALQMRGDAPPKTVQVLIDMLQDESLVIFLGAGAKVTGVGTESKGGASTTKLDQGGDARYLAIDPLMLMGPEVRARPEVRKALERAAKDKSEELSTKAQEALKALRP